MPIKNIKAFSLSQNTGESTDPIRNTIQSFWSYDGSELVYDTRNLYNPTEKEANTKLLLFKFGRPLKSQESVIELDGPDTTLDIKTAKEGLDITPEYLNEFALESPAGFTPSGRTKVSPEDNFDSYIEDQIIPSLGTPLAEYKINLDSPIEYVSSVDNKSAIAGTVNFVYNYGLENYEDTIKPAGVVEANLANFYKIFSIDTEKITKRRVMRKLNQSARQNSGRTVRPPDPIQDFFMNSDGFIEALDKQSVKDSFPFYNEVYFTNPPDNIEDDKFQEALKASGLLMAVCNLMNREDFQISQQENSVIIDSTPFINSYLSSSYQDDTQTSFKVSPALKGTPINLYDVPEMLKVMYEVLPPKSSLGPPSPRQRSTTVESLRDKGFLTDGEQADYRLDTISQLVGRTTLTNNYENALDDLVDTINELISNDDNFKNYKEILEGKKNTYQSNVLFYRIKKFEEGSDTPIQNFWIPAEKGYRGVRYIDTQVKYGKMYRYEVNAFKFVIGTEYVFNEKETKKINFSQDLAKYEDGVSETIDQLRTLAGFREEDPSLMRLIMMQRYLTNNEIDINLLNSAESLAMGGSQIALFARNIIKNGSAQYKGVEFFNDDLTNEERRNLELIDDSWRNLTNNWILGEGATEKSLLFDLEKSLQKARIISLVRNIINNADRDLVNFDPAFTVRESPLPQVEDLTSSELERVRDNISSLSYEKFDQDFAWREAGGYKYYSYLTPKTAETFDISSNEDTSIFPISRLEAKQGIISLNTKAKKQQAERDELTEFYYDFFRSEMLAVEKEINEYLENYISFIDAASSIDIATDYKRINKYSLTVESKPTVRFAELPYFESEGMILDNPPIYPNVNVITYRDVADKLSLFMNSGQGEIEIVPVSFSDAEDTFITNYRKSRKLNDFQPILYKSDETENLGTVFEIRRLSSPPESYDSFRTARTVTTINSIKAGTLPAATYDDIVRSNTKYYYIFRVADRRGTISYPSGVIEIEIIENSGIIYPIIKPYEFKKQKTDTTKNLKRLLNIVPRITQVVPPVDTLSYESLTPGPTSILGREEESLFGKQFKLRLTSKQTGKAVDLNLNFKATVIEASEAE